MNKCTAVTVSNKMEEKICRTCLSTDRMISTLGSLTYLYEAILGLTTVKTTPVEVCWECRGVLLSTKKFLHKARVANDYLNDINIKRNHQSLSNLKISSVKYFNTEISYEVSSEKHGNLEDTKYQVFAGEEKYEEDVPLNHSIEIKKQESKPSLETKETTAPSKEKYVKSNKWAKIKAIENKLPKFKLIKGSKIAIDVIYQKIQMNMEQFRVCMEREKVCILYLSSNTKCAKCVLPFMSKTALERHNSKYHNISNVYQCDTCQCTFPHKRHLVTHTASHSYVFECRVCHQTSVSKLHARIHLQRHGKIYQCAKCALNYQSRREFYDHHRKMHENFICDYCGVAFKLRYCIQDHIRKQHTPRRCDQCGKVFARNGGLWLHRKVAHCAAPPRPAYCVECDKSFKNVYSYKWHLGNSVRHNPKKKVSIPCGACEKVFTKRIYMLDHYNLVHLKIYNYRCEECDKNFVRAADLRSHTRRAHTAAAPRRHRPCTVCDRAFTNNKILKNHLRIHTGERPFACDVCPARFTQRAAMVTHRRNVHRNNVHLDSVNRNNAHVVNVHRGNVNADKYTGSKTYSMFYFTYSHFSLISRPKV